MPVSMSACVWVLCSDDDVIDEAVALGSAYSMGDFVESRLSHLPLYGVDVFDGDRLTGWRDADAFEHRVSTLYRTRLERVSEALERLESFLPLSSQRQAESIGKRAACSLRYVEELIASQRDEGIDDWPKIFEALDSLSLATSKAVHRRSVFVDCTTSIPTSDIPTDVRLRELMERTHRRLVLVPASLHFSS